MALFMYAMLASPAAASKNEPVHTMESQKTATTHNTVCRFHMCVYVYVSSFVHQ